MFSVPGNEYTAIIYFSSEEAKDLRKAKGITEEEYKRLKKIASFVSVQSERSVKSHEGNLSYEQDREYQKQLDATGVITAKGIDDCTTYHYAGTTLRVFPNTNAASVNIGVD